MTDQQLRIKMLREVALRADGFYADAEDLGQRAAKGLTGGKRSQITTLEGMANSALKTSDVLDLIKIRTARQAAWQEGDWGPDLLKYLSRDLRTQRRHICNTLEIDADGVKGLEVHLMLIREFVHQLAAQYEYACWKAETR